MVSPIFAKFDTRYYATSAKIPLKYSHINIGSTYLHFKLYSCNSVGRLARYFAVRTIDLLDFCS